MNESDNEPEITINGSKLTPAQSLTIEVALNNFYIDLKGGVLGTDGYRGETVRLYKLRISEIQNKIRGNK